MSTTRIDHVLASRNMCGAWGYRVGSEPNAEATSLCVIALLCHGVAPKECLAAAGWLATIQRKDGAVPVSDSLKSPTWSTALALLAWCRLSESQSGAFGGNIQRATQWLLKTKGETYPPAPAIFGHDLSLVGWPWAPDTHSWIEPTAYAVRALSECGLRNHPRVREGVRLLIDRAIPDGGWNYGNTRVLTHMLRPFPATTGIALFGLAGEPRREPIERAIKYLKNALLTVRAPWSLSWGLIGLSAWDDLPTNAAQMLAGCAERLDSEAGLVHRRNTMDDALMLWAQWLSVSSETEVSHGA